MTMCIGIEFFSNRFHLFYELEELALGGGRVPKQEHVDVSPKTSAVRQVLETTPPNGKDEDGTTS